jgi:hypothetical protein
LLYIYQQVHLSQLALPCTHPSLLHQVQVVRYVKLYLTSAGADADEPNSQDSSVLLYLER